jgi:serine/threonine protein phosphatase PrpC
MNDPLIVAGVVLLCLALAFGLFGRKPARHRPRATAPAVPPSVPPMPDLLRTDLDDEDTTLVTSASELTALLAPQPPAISALLAEALAEAREASDATEATQEPPNSTTTRLIYQYGAEQDELTGPVPRFQISVHGDTDRGLRRKQNEDALLLWPEQGLLAVADGMGGYSGGQVASSLAIDSLRESFRTDAATAHAAGSGPPRALEVASAMQRANDAVFKAARAQPELRNMGTTLVALRYLPNKQRIYVGHVGDSRCYRLRAGELRQLTTDHAMKELGLVGPRQNDLFKAIGIENDVAVDVIVDKPQPGDVYLLCSDGLTKMVAPERIRDLLLEEEDGEAAVYGLIEQANDAGGKDNITVVVAKVSAPNHGPSHLEGAA